MILNQLPKNPALPSLLIAALLTTTLTGCGRGTVPVNGKLVFSDDQTPVTGLDQWVITMELPEKKLSATGIVQADGAFLVSTFEEGDGAMPGTYSVVITPPIASLTSDGPIPAPIIDPATRSLDTTPLKVTIEPGIDGYVLMVDRAKR